MPSTPYEEQMNFFEAVTGLIFEPRATTQSLLDRDDPPYSTSMLLCLLLTVVVPIFAQRLKYGIAFENVELGVGILVTVICTFVGFIVMESLFLGMLGIAFTFRHLIAGVSYALAPLMFSIWLIYLFNYFHDGSLSIVTLLMTGYARVDDRFLEALPWALLIVQLLVFLVFFYSLRAIGQLYTFSALLVALLSLIPFYVALIFGALIGDRVQPGTLTILLELFERGGAAFG